jgi:hypothetical protein
MTAHYARLSDKTVREHWEKARKVNAEGQPVQISPDGPLGDAAWSRHRLSRATQALPNGYCDLPLVRTCPHAKHLVSHCAPRGRCGRVLCSCSLGRRRSLRFVRSRSLGSPGRLGVRRVAAGLGGCGG